jgi:uncharacterized protein
MTRAAGVTDWLLDTGFAAGELRGVDEMAALTGGRTHEVVRLETVAESVITELDRPSRYADVFTGRLTELAGTAIAAKSVLAYRAGFDHNLTEPSPRAVTHAAQRWTDHLQTGSEPARLTDLTLISFGLHTAQRLGLPLQLHVGLGDRDLDLHRADPLQLTGFLRTPASARSPVLLLHCYPYERQAGYLAAAFDHVYLDVGLAVHHLGARSRAVVARSLELAPFTKVLYSSDGCGPAEFHYLGARLWREATARVLGGWVADDLWSAADARRVAALIGRDNARRVYRLG